jgi:hypothetical protein
VTTVIPVREMWYHVRGLRAHHRYLAVGVFVVACGAGISSALIHIVDTILWSPLPVSNPDRIRFVYKDYDGVLLGFRYEEAMSVRNSSSVFRDTVLRGPDRARVSQHGDNAEWLGDVVSSNYFEFLGHKPVIGRTFATTDDTAAAEPVVIISDAIWRSQFNADKSVIGASIVLDPIARGTRAERGRAYTVIGVMGPASERVANPWQSTQYWVPIVPRSVDYACEIDVLRFGQYYVVGPPYVGG